MENLIKALRILRKFGEGQPCVFQAEHDEIVFWGYDPADFSCAYLERLDELGFHVEERAGEEVFVSYRYGGC